MRYFSLVLLLVIICVGCATSKKEWANFTGKDCEKYVFGRIETKRLLTAMEKLTLAQSGIHIQEFIFETQYLGSWNKEWNSKNLDKTPVNSLVAFTAQDKIASGIQITEVQRISETPGESMVLIQTIATVTPDELKTFGQVVFGRDYSYRMIVPHHNLMKLLEFPCLRLMSIIKYDYDPDSDF